MRTTLSLLGLFVFILGLRAQPLLTVTPQTLAGWTVIGADSRALAKQPELSLPAGAQLARSFAGAGLGLRVSTKVTLGPGAGDWPVLEIGDAALLFAREGSSGKLLLVLGGDAPMDLPFTFSLDANGASVAPLTFTFSRHGTVVSVGGPDRTLQFPAAPATGSAVDVVASAGATEAWAIQQLEVTTGTPAAANSTVGHSAGTSSSNAFDSGSTTRARAAAAGADPGAAVNPSVPANDPADPAAVTVSSRKDTLEIFTPPAVRHGRAAAIRAAVQAKNN